MLPGPRARRGRPVAVSVRSPKLHLQYVSGSTPRLDRALRDWEKATGRKAQPDE